MWSPQLHLEVLEGDEKSCVLHGVFGPNPAIWTFFMFLHFFVAGFFIAFGVWAYTHWSLKYDYVLQLSLMLLMVVVWFALYIVGQMGKASAKADMLELRQFMDEIINT